MNALEKRNQRLRLAAGIVFWALAVGVIFAMFGFSGQSGEESASISMGLTEWLLERLPFIRMDIAAFEHLLRKLAHFSLFALEGFLLYFALRFSLRSKKRAFIAAAVVCALAAVLNELHQLLDPDRSCKITDMLLDFSGSITGMLAALLIVWIVRRLRRR